MARPKVSFILQNRKRNNGYPVYLRVTHKGRIIHFFTGFIFEQKEWDKKKQRMNPRFLRANEINGLLESWAGGVNQIITELILSRVQFDLETVRKEFDKRFRGKNENRTTWQEMMKETEGKFLDFEEWLRKQGREKGTIKNHRSNAKKLMAFFGDKKIELETLYDYEDFMVEIEGLEPGTIEKRLDTVKVLLRYFREKKISVPDYKPRRKLKTIKKPVIAVRLAEYHQLLKHVPSSKRLQKVKDMFIVGYSTGLRISNQNLKEKDIQGGRIVKFTQKKNKVVQIPLLDDLKEVLQRYNGKAPYMGRGKYNAGLKELFKEAGLNRKVMVIHVKNDVVIEEVKELWEVASSKMGRKGLATKLKNAGVEEGIINLIGGWAPGESEAYTEINWKAVEEAVKKAG